MIKNSLIVIITLFILLLVKDVFPVLSANYTMAGGPAGGTYTHFANAVAELSKNTDVTIQPIPSKGSIENIKKIHTGRANFGIAYSGDIYLGRNGEMKRDGRKYTKVLALGYFYSAPAQLVVKADDGITSTTQLTGKRVGVGNFGSGAAGNCELFFKKLGIWDQVNIQFLGYKKAVSAFKGGGLDAFWLFTGFPNSSVKDAAAYTKISLLNVYNDADKVKMFEKYPYFTKVIIPAGTYAGVKSDTISFQDSTIWIANERIPEKDVYTILKAVYSPEGLAFMKEAHKAARSMSVENGLQGIVTPLHPGAGKFWKEKGLDIK